MTNDKSDYQQFLTIKKPLADVRLGKGGKSNHVNQKNTYFSSFLSM